MTTTSTDNKPLQNMRHIYKEILACRDNKSLIEQLLQLAAICKKQQNTNALQSCIQLLLLNGHRSPIILSDIACLLSQQNRHIEACYFFNIAKHHLQLHSGHFNRLFIKSHWQLNRYSEVINYFEKHIVKPVDDHFMMRNIGMSYYHLQLHQKAYQILSSVSEALPDDANLRAILNHTKYRNKHILNTIGLSPEFSSGESNNHKELQKTQKKNMSLIQDQLSTLASHDEDDIQLLGTLRDKTLASIWQQKDQAVLDLSISNEDKKFWNAHNVGMAQILLLSHPVEYAMRRFYQEGNPIHYSLNDWTTYYKAIINQVRGENVSVVLNFSGAKIIELDSLILPYSIDKALKASLKVFNDLSQYALNENNALFIHATGDEALFYSTLSDAFGLAKFGDFDKAKEIYFDLLDKNGLQSIVVSHLLRIPASIFSAAEIDHLEKLILDNTKNTFLWNEFGQFISKVDKERAIFILNKLMAIQSPKFKTLLEVGKMYLELGEYDQALDALTFASKINPADANCLMLLASAQLKLGKTDSGFSTMKQAIATQLVQPNSIARFANLCVDLERFEALQELVIFHGPQINFQAPTWMSWAVKFERFGYFTGMLACLDRFKQLSSPDDSFEQILQKWTTKRIHLLKKHIS